MRLGTYLLILSVTIAGCQVPIHQTAPPMEMMAMNPGPGMDGPGPGVIVGDPSMSMMPAQPSQVAFVGPDGMVINWDVGMAGTFDSAPLICPGRYNFPQGAIYRLKLTSIPGRPGVELYPTLEVGPSVPRTQAFLSHNAMPVQFTEEDFSQVLSGNFVSKVIYLPDPEYQELALAGVETLVSTRLDPGVDPIVEADRRGAILGVIRMGNKDLEIPSQMAGMPGVVPVSYGVMMSQPTGMPGAPMGVAMPSGMGTVPSNYISGVTGPQYGIPITGTPIGLPGPPHLPFGAPAGLQKHVIRNHTVVHNPLPPTQMRVDVRQPGVWQTRPATHAYIGGTRPIGNMQ